MKISIIGHTGFVGSYLIKNLRRKYSVCGFSLRNIDFKKEYKTYLENFFSADVIINCAASLNPKTYNDYFINTNLMKEILMLNKKFRKIVIHLSTTNVLIKGRKDKYTKSKKACENLIKQYSKLFILRLPLIVKKKKKILEKKGQIKGIYNFLDMIKIPYYPFIFPGHTYNPIEIRIVKKIIEKIIKKKIKKKFINLKGSQKINLFEIAESIAKEKNVKLIKINFEKIYKALPLFLQNIIKHQSGFIQQLAPIDNTQY